VPGVGSKEASRSTRSPLSSDAGWAAPPTKSGVPVAGSASAAVRSERYSPMARKDSSRLGWYSILSPWSRRWWELVGMRAHRVHEYDMAARAYKRGLALGSDSGWALYNLALTYDRLDDTARLNAVMTTLRRLAPADADSLDVYFKATRHAGSVAP